MSKHALIVDDESTLLHNLAQTLRRENYQVSAVDNAADARQILAQNTTDLVCLDIGLIDANGLDLLAEIRQQDATLPVIVMSGLDSNANRTRASQLDASAFLAKPFSLSRFKELISVYALGGERDEAGPSPLPASYRRQENFSVVMYSHDSIGLGHMRRNTNIAARLVEEAPNVNVLMVVGCPAGLFFELPPRVDFVKLPSIVKVERDSWKSGKLEITKDLARELRTNLIQRAIEVFKPHLFLVDHVPTGVWGELLPTLEHLRAEGSTKIVLGLRDILDEPEILRRSWANQGIYDVIEKYYDQVLIYGSEQVYPSATLYGLEAEDKAKHAYCGYLSAARAIPGNGKPARRGGRKKSILITAGGGFDAHPFMSACLDALAEMRKRHRPDARIVTGPLMEKAMRTDLERRASALGVAIETCVPNMGELMCAADLIVTMAGYNTLVEAVMLGRPTLVVPRKGPSAEQQIRAKVFAESGLVTAVGPDEAQPSNIARLMRECLDSPKLPETRLSNGGASQAVQHLKALLDISPAAPSGYAPERSALNA